jgi:Propanediol dehydratase, large subunit
MFAGSNLYAEDFDDYNVLQRDLKVDGGLRPVTEVQVLAVRRKAAKAMQAIFAALNFPPVTDEEVELDMCSPTAARMFLPRETSTRT